MFILIACAAFTGRLLGLSALLEQIAVGLSLSRGFIVLLTLRRFMRACWAGVLCSFRRLVLLFTLVFAFTTLTSCFLPRLLFSLGKCSIR